MNKYECCENCKVLRDRSKPYAGLTLIREQIIGESVGKHHYYCDGCVPKVCNYCGQIKDDLLNKLKQYGIFPDRDHQYCISCIPKVLDSWEFHLHREFLKIKHKVCDDLKVL